MLQGMGSKVPEDSRSESPAQRFLVLRSFKNILKDFLLLQVERFPVKRIPRKLPSGYLGVEDQGQWERGSCGKVN